MVNVKTEKSVGYIYLSSETKGNSKGNSQLFTRARKQKTLIKQGLVRTVWRTRKDSNPISPVTKPFYLYTLLSLTYTVPLSINLKQPLCVRLCVHYIAINGAGGLPRGGEGGCCELVIVTVSGEIQSRLILNQGEGGLNSPR